MSSQTIPPGALTVWPSSATGAAMTIFGHVSGSAGTADSSEMLSAYRLTAGAVGKAMEHHDRRQSLALVRVQRSMRPRVLVVGGRHDQMHEVLEANQIPHFRIGAENAHYLPVIMALDVHHWIGALLVNCNESFSTSAIPSVVEFVEGGGLLMTSDWALTHLIQHAFPEKIRHSGGSTKSFEYGLDGKEFVEVEPGDTGNPTLLAAFSAAREAGVAVNWWLDPSSHVIEVVDETAVKVMLRSPELKRRYGSDVIMAAFQAGIGMVIHQISHVKLQHAMGGSGTPQLPTRALARFAEAFGTGADFSFANVHAGAAIAAAVSNIAFISPILRAIGEEAEGPIIVEKR